MPKSKGGCHYAAALAIAIAVPCWAQSTEPVKGQLAEVVVTAQRRPERLQSVPISMSVVTRATIANFGEQSLSDYAAGIPNLSLSTGAGAGGHGSSFGVSSTRAIAIRGVYGNNTTSFYLNDTPIPMSLDPRSLDLERVEVLRGPQGTLFGASAMGGTIRLITREPRLHGVSGKVNLDGSYVDHGGGGYSADGTLNVALVPGAIGAIVNIFSGFDPGLYERTWGGPLDPRSPIDAYPPGGAPIGHKDHVGAQQTTGVLMQLKISPPAIPGLTLAPIFIYQRSSTNGYPLADYAPNDFTQTRPLDVPEAVTDRWSFAGLTVRQQTTFGRFIGSGTYFYRNAFDLEDMTDVNAILFWSLPYYVPAPLLSTIITKTWTGEARFESNFSGPVQMVLGGYYSLTHRPFYEYSNAPGLNAASGGAIGTDLDFVEATPNLDKERAVFVDVTYNITKKLQASAGIRRAYLYHSEAYTANGALNGGFSGPPATYSSHGEYDSAPRYTVRYNVAPKQMLYATAAKGFRIGGTNSLLPPFCSSDLASLGLHNGSPFDSDSLWSYEVGSKNTWSGGHIQSRVAIYQINWAGIQQSVLLPCTYTITANSGAARSDGAEFEADIEPVSNLLFDVSLGYENARITEATPQSLTVVGQSLTGVPKVTGSITGQYTIPLGERTAFIRGQWAYTGARRSFNNVAPPAGLPLGSYSILNLRTGITQGPWQLTFFVDNVLNKLGIIGDLLPEGAELPGRPRLFVTRPRTVGVQLARKF